MKTKISIFLLLFASLFPVFSLTQIPELEKPVMDLAGIVDRDVEEQIDEYLKEIYEQTGIQIAVLTVSELGNETIENFSMRVCEDWKLGTDKQDNGVLLTVAYKDHKVRIEVGYGLEGLLTDVKSSRIINEVVVPAFMEDYKTTGIKKAILRIAEISLDGKEIDSETGDSMRNEEDDDLGMGFVIFWVIIFVYIIGQGSGLFPFLKCLILGKPYVRPKGFNFSSGSSDSSGYSSSSYSSSYSSSDSGYSGGGGDFGGGGSSGSW